MGSRASEVPSRERWLVQHGFNATQVMTRRDLESAFRRGDISARALVCRDGTARWQTLAELMDLDPDTTLESISLMPVASDVALPDLPELPLPKPAPTPLEAPTEIHVESPRKRALKTLSLSVALAAFAGVFAGASTLFGGAPAPADPVNATLAPAEP